MALLLSLILTLGSVEAAKPKAPTLWWEHALRLTGESDAVRNRAIRKLKKIPDLKAALESALRGDKQALAIDTIVALDLEEFLPTLRELAPKDPTGVTLLAVNHFVTPESAPKMATWFRAILQSHPPTPVTQILLDTLGRLGALVPIAEIQSQLKRGQYEVADGVMNYVRLMVLNHRKSEYLALVEPLMRSPIYQIRLRTAYFIHDLPPEWRQQVSEVLDRCQKDDHPEVRAKCEGKKS